MSEAAQGGGTRDSSTPGSVGEPVLGPVTGRGVDGRESVTVGEKTRHPDYDEGRKDECLDDFILLVSGRSGVGLVSSGQTRTLERRRGKKQSVRLHYCY